MYARVCVRIRVWHGWMNLLGAAGRDIGSRAEERNAEKKRRKSESSTVFANLIVMSENCLSYLQRIDKII